MADVAYQRVHSCSMAHPYSMKRLYFILLLCPLLGSSQKDGLEGLLKRNKFDSTARYISLPVKNLQLPAAAVNHSWSRSEFVISSDSIYYRVFAKYNRDSLPIMNFDNHDLVLRSSCSQCFVLCPTANPCHRNACRYSLSWFTRLSRKRTLIPNP
jgi:hypothetical protein